MKDVMRLTAVVNRVEVADPETCLANLKTQLAPLLAEPWDVLVLPRMALCPPSSGSLLDQKLVLESALEQLHNLRILTLDCKGTLFVGLPLTSAGRTVEGTAVLQGGKLLGVIPTEGPCSFDVDLPALDPETVFSCGTVRLMVAAGDPMDLPLRAKHLQELGCQLVLVPAYEPALAGREHQVRETARALSQSLGMAVAVVNGGVGDTSSPYSYQGHICICEEGRVLAEQSSARDPFACTCDLDGDILRAIGQTRRTAAGMGGDVPLRLPCQEKRGFPKRRVSPNPYLPDDAAEADDYLAELFGLQVDSLASRLENTGIDRLVVGVSGGLDSTLALLVAAAACDRLAIPRRNLYGVTMPGFGTTDRTYFNALLLIETLRATSLDISIRAAVTQHFEDIGHDLSNKDVTYENAQARERTQILLDLANQVRGLVVGTGDLTEEALGWSTFAGDQMANYNVNVCLTKAMVRGVVRVVMERRLLSGVEEVLPDILDTPVSPELLPPDPQGEMVQKSEEILGPYELHDFFLYYLARYQLRPYKVLEYAQAAYGSTYPTDYLQEKLWLFVRRFITGQFKRSCAPDCACITEFNLTGVRYAIPSDLSPRLLLRDLGLAEH